MPNRTLILPLLVTSMLSACGGDDDQPREAVAPSQKTHVVFSPASSQVPIPNDLLFVRGEGADGTLNAGEDPTNPVITGIDQLDGNSVTSPIDITIDGQLDPDQNLDAANFVALDGAVLPNPNQNVFLLPLTYPGLDGLLQAVGEVPTFSEAVAYSSGVPSVLAELAVPVARAEIISLDEGLNNTLRILPLQPLEPKTKYLVFVTDLLDDAGNPVFASTAYEVFRDPTEDLTQFGDSAESLLAVRGAILGWEALATGYLNFKQQVFELAGTAFEAPSDEDVIVSFTFTTGGTTDILEHVAAPETFFEKNLIIGYRQDAIEKLVNGTYGLDGAPSAELSITENTIIATLNVLLTQATLGDVPNALYNAEIAAAINAGADYSTIATDASAAYLMQLAAAEAAIAVHDSGSEAAGDIAPFVDIYSEALGTVQAIAGGAGVTVPQLFPAPAPRASRFFRADPAQAIFELLAAPSTIYQGEITLPQFMATPETDPSVIVTTRWQANAAIGGIIDAASGNPAGTTPPSDKITYRYPFPTQQAESTVPITVTMPDEATLSSFGITRPAEGWPTIIFVHGILGDRSMSLPMANALAFACVAPDLSGPSGLPCFATVAIDRPLHGIAPAGSTVPGLISSTDPDNPIMGNIPSDTPNSPSVTLTERHFDLTADLEANPIPMDYTSDFGASGSLFINLTSFATVRDNLRQMGVDLLNLNASLSSMDVNADGTANELDSNNVFFIGVSLGGIDGIPFIATNNAPRAIASPFSNLTSVKAASIFNSGGGVVRLLTNSPSFAPRILQGLEAASSELSQGLSGLESYLSVFQGIVDSVDPINYAAQLSRSEANTGIFLTELIGDGTDANLPDTTIPNAADTIWGANNGPLTMTVAETGFMINNFPAPLSGTEPLIAQFEAVEPEMLEEGEVPVYVIRYEEGTHGTPVSADNLEVFQDMLGNTLSLFSGLIE